MWVRHAFGGNRFVIRLTYLYLPILLADNKNQLFQNGTIIAEYDQLKQLHNGVETFRLERNAQPWMCHLHCARLYHLSYLGAGEMRVLEHWCMISICVQAWIPLVSGFFVPAKLLLSLQWCFAENLVREPWIESSVGVFILFIVPSQPGLMPLILSFCWILFVPTFFFFG